MLSWNVAMDGAASGLTLKSAASSWEKMPPVRLSYRRDLA